MYFVIRQGEGGSNGKGRRGFESSDKLPSFKYSNKTVRYSIYFQLIKLTQKCAEISLMQKFPDRRRMGGRQAYTPFELLH